MIDIFKVRAIPLKEFDTITDEFTFDYMAPVGKLPQDIRNELMAQYNTFTFIVYKLSWMQRV